MQITQRKKGFGRYFTNISWLFLEKAVRMVVGLLVGVWVARYLGPERFGLLSYAVSFAGLFSAFADLGLKTVLVRELVDDKEKRDIILGTSFVLKLVAGIFVLAVLAIVVQFTSSDHFTNILILIIGSSFIFNSFNVIDFYFQSRVLSKFVVWAGVCSLCAASAFKVVLILSKAPLIFFAVAVTVENILLALMLLFFYLNQKLNPKHWKFRWDKAKTLLNDAWPLIFSGVLVMVYMRIDQIMLKEMLNSEAVGQYAAAVRISEIWYFIPAAITGSFFPAIIRSKQQNEFLYLKRLRMLYTVLIWTALPIAILMTFLSNKVVFVLYGSDYKQAASVLVIHIWIGLFVFLGIAFSKYLIIENYTKKVLYKAVAGTFTNVVFNFILIPKYGIVGAAIGTLLGQSVANYIYDFFDKDLHIQAKMKTMAIINPFYILTNWI